MRKVILLVAFIVATVGLKAQNEPFPDGGFESCWVEKTAAKGKYQDFKDDFFLKTLNKPIYTLTDPFGDGPLTAFKETTDARDGHNALKLVSNELSSPYGTIFLPGAAGNIEVDIIGVDCSLGRPFSSRPSGIIGWYKYLPVNGDSAAIEVWLEKSGTVLGRGKQVINNAVSNWSQFNIPIIYTSNETPDKIVVIFASSAKYDFTSVETLMQCQGQKGSELYLDDIEFDYTEPENIPDGGFETCWTTKQGQGASGDEYNYEDFDDSYFFNSLNQLKAIGGPLTALKESTDVYAGNYALKLVSENIMGSIFLPGAMGNITLEYTGVSPMPSGVSLGRPFTSRPTAIEGFHKYVPVDGDSAAIEIILKKGGVEIGSGKQVITSEVPTWSQFRVPVNYSSNDTPDTIILLFATSAKYDFTSVTTLMQCEGQLGSALFLDDLELDYTGVGIKEMLDPKIKMSVYPNPSKEAITVQVAKEIQGMVIVYDYLARKIGEYPINGTQIKINVQNYAQGSYLLNVIENNKVITTSRFVKE